jgi:hypothetical protein
MSVSLSYQTGIYVGMVGRRVYGDEPVPQGNDVLELVVPWERVIRVLAEAAKRCRDALGEYVRRRIGEESTRLAKAWAARDTKLAKAWAAREWQRVTHDGYRHDFTVAAPYLAVTVVCIVVAALISIVVGG